MASRTKIHRRRTQRERGRLLVQNRCANLLLYVDSVRQKFDPLMSDGSHISFDDY
jgi:hypothetical protein